MKLNYPRSGRSNKVRYANIVHWNYSDSSLRKMDVGLAQRIGIATAGIWWAGFSYFSIKRINVTETTQEIPEETSYLSIGYSNVNTQKILHPSYGFRVLLRICWC